MKKIIFSFILFFGATLFMPQSSFSQIAVKSKHNNSTKKVVVKKSNKHKGVVVRSRPTHHHPSRVVAVKPSRPKVIVKHPNRVRRNYIWVEGHWKWSYFHRDYIWIKGKWKRQRRGYHWIPGFWEVSLDGFVWIDGYWAR